MNPEVTGRATIATIPPAGRCLLAAATWAQGPLLAYLLAAPWPGWVALGSLSAVLAALVLRWFGRASAFAGGLTIAMLALGNVGMLVGWMADFGFGPLVREGVCLCGCWSSALGRGLVSGPSWMQGGMLMASAPALVVVRPARSYLDAVPGRRRDWITHLALCPLGMWTGMLGAAALLAAVPVVNPVANLVATFLAMSGGMAAGMLLTCRALDRLATRRRA